MKNQSPTSEPLNSRVQELENYLLLIRKIQDSTDASFLESLGGLNMQELNVLNILGDNESCIMSDIAKQASLSLSSVTVIVEKLVKAGLAERLRSEQDRRIVHGSLTPAGQQIYHIQIQHMQGLLRKMLSLLSEDEQTQFLSIFQKITRTWPGLV